MTQKNYSEKNLSVYLFTDDDMEGCKVVKKDARCHFQVKKDTRKAKEVFFLLPYH